jgi:hypothetical protein
MSAQNTVRCMIGLATWSLLAVCPHPAEGLSAAQFLPRRNRDREQNHEESHEEGHGEDSRASDDAP